MQTKRIEPLDEAREVLREMALRELELINYLLSRQMSRGPWTPAMLSLMNLIRVCIHSASLELLLDALEQARVCYAEAAVGEPMDLDRLADIARAALGEVAL